ncbi:MAG: MBL fold metallo-hydrolase [Woeseiaceae bacterium]|nr:MBL fold metallo-hydrolase [Woeseiaceae bacterium]
MTTALTPGVPRTVAAGVVRLVAPNPGLMTGPGTNTYILGDADKLVIDPGPAIPAHIDAICEAAGTAIRRILVTHTHPDHSPAARQLAARTGALLLGQAAPAGRHQDQSFVPHRTLADGETLDVDDSSLKVLHTPGHASNHLCYLRESDGLLFTGDHVINGSTVVIDPPDGNMSDYLASLARLRKLPLVTIAPGHGELLQQNRTTCSTGSSRTAASARRKSSRRCGGIRT